MYSCAASEKNILADSFLIEFLEENKLQILTESNGFVDPVFLRQYADLLLCDHKMSVPFMVGNFFAYNAKRASSSFEVSNSSV
jgi:hypothetical protein